MPLDYQDARPYYMFNRPPKFDVYRSAVNRMYDLKRLEELRYAANKLEHIDERNLIISFFNHLSF